MSIEIVDNPSEHRYELTVDGTLEAITVYELHGKVADFIHTQTLSAAQGEGLGGDVVRHGLDDMSARGLHVRPFCPFVRQFILDHPRYLDLVRPADRAEFKLS